jgi:hypothetical protein
MTGTERKAELVRRRVKLKTIAATTGYSVQQVSAVIHGRRCRPVEDAIAEACGRPRESMFPLEEPAE